LSAERPSITVVTVCRNALALLRPTVESVLAQRVPSIETGAAFEANGADDELAGRYDFAGREQDAAAGQQQRQ